MILRDGKRVDCEVIEIVGRPRVPGASSNQDGDIDEIGREIETFLRDGWSLALMTRMGGEYPNGMPIEFHHYRLVFIKERGEDGDGS